MKIAIHAFITSSLDSFGSNIHTVRVPIFGYENQAMQDLQNVKATFTFRSNHFNISASHAASWFAMLGKGTLPRTAGNGSIRARCFGRSLRGM
jgi:hypothetical protein